MTKKEMAKAIAEEMGLTQLQVQGVVRRVFDGITETLVREGRIELRNFGVFEVKRRKARKARNPRTGDPVHVPSKNVVTFKPGKRMEERVSQMTNVPDMTEEEDEDAVPVEAGVGSGHGHDDHEDSSKPKGSRGRKAP